jgi:hypothetical protein
MAEIEETDHTDQQLMAKLQEIVPEVRYTTFSSKNK